MRILIVHNDYGARSGEEVVVDRQIVMLKSLDMEVVDFRRSSQGQRNSLWGQLKAFLSGFYAYTAISALKKLIKDNPPDLAIVHNLYPFISPAALKVIKKANIPIIMTIHNYRLICPTGLFMRDAKVCELCLNASEWNCIKHNCENSVPKSFAYASRNWYARKTKAYINNIDAFACITNFQAVKLVQAGFDKSKMEVIPNSMDQIPPYKYQKGGYVGISGRISKEKGIELLLKLAHATPHIQYVFAGAQRKSDKWDTSIPANCSFLGYLNEKDLDNFYKNAQFILIASLWYEGFPMVILDASARGKACIGPAHAGFIEIIDKDITGLHFKVGDLNSLQDKVLRLWDNENICKQMGENAYNKLKKQYSSQVVKKAWKKLIEKYTC